MDMTLTVESENHYGWGRVSEDPSFRPTRPGMVNLTVQAVRIGDFLADRAPNLDVFKIDTQGRDCFVIKGGLPLLDKSPKVVLMIEWRFYYKDYEREGPRRAACAQMFIDHGFKYIYSPAIFQMNSDVTSMAAIDA